MSRLWVCDQCEHTQAEPMTFTLKQLCDEVDADGYPTTVTLHLCSTDCLCNLAMGLTLDYPEDAT